MPLDAEPTAAGEWVLEPTGRATYSPGLRLDEPHYVSHFATCPDADAHRRR